MHRSPPHTSSICAVKKNKENSGDESKRRKEALSQQERREKAATPKELCMALTKVSSRKETDTEGKRGGGMLVSGDL